MSKEGRFFSVLSPEDFTLVGTLLGGFRPPDLVIAPDGEPYLVRWHVIPRNREANVYLHLQVASDPERPLHDHPWANTSVILSGGYLERMFCASPRSWADAESARLYARKKGDVIFRDADWPHRLFLPKGTPYTLTLFSTGPNIRDWGFWTQQGWRRNTELVENLPDGRSIFKGPLVRNGKK